MMAFVFSITNFFHAALVVSFVGVTGLLMTVSVARRARLRTVELSWNAGRLFGLPLIPTAFVSIVLGVMVVELAQPRPLLSVHWLLQTGYLVGGLFWYIGAMLASSVVVSDWGVTWRSGGETKRLPWHEVIDYVVTDSGRHAVYVFFRVDGQGRKQRTEIKVPVGRQVQFKRTVEAKLDTRFNYYTQRRAGKRGNSGYQRIEQT